MVKTYYGRGPLFVLLSSGKEHIDLGHIDFTMNWGLRDRNAIEWVGP